VLLVPTFSPKIAPTALPSHLPTGSTIDEHALFQSIVDIASDGKAWELSLQNDTISKWQQYQASVVATLKQTSASPLRVVIFSAVQNQASTVERFTNTARTLRANDSGDHFNFAFFHLDAQTTLWDQQKWYHEDFVVLRKSEPGCKLEFLIQITEKLAEQYDYIWFLDEDMDFTLFNWDVYRWLLVRLRAPVSQPAYVSKSKISYPRSLGMLSKQLGETKEQVVAREVLLVEGGSAIIAAQFWPPMLDRIVRAKTQHDLLTDWGVDSAWSGLGLVSKQFCGTAGNVVVFASPILHVNTRTNKGQDHDRSGASAKAGANRCDRHCGPLCQDWQAVDMPKVEKAMHCGSLAAANTTFKGKRFGIIANKIAPEKVPVELFGEGFGELELYSVASLKRRRAS
jgi:hypothetical protein